MPLHDLFIYWNYILKRLSDDVNALQRIDDARAHVCMCLCVRKCGVASARTWALFLCRWYGSSMGIDCMDVGHEKLSIHGIRYSAAPFL